MQHALNRGEVHLVTGVFRAGKIQRLIRVRFDEVLQRDTLLGHVEEVTRHLDRHAAFDIALGPLDCQESRQFVLRVEALDVVRRLVGEERLKAVDDLALVLGILDRIPERLLSVCRNVCCHVSPRNLLSYIEINVTHCTDIMC